VSEAASGAAIAATAARALRNSLAALGAELRALRPTGPHARQAVLPGLVVVLATLAACALHLPNPWWAAMSGFITTQATRQGAVRKGALRLIGTVAGAAAALAAVDWLTYDPALCCLALFAVTAVGMLGVVVSRHGYAWQMGAITFAIIVLLALDDPEGAFATAVFRATEVTVGVTAAVLAALLLAPDGEAAPAAPAPGWTDLLGRQWPAVLHAVRSGIAVAVLPIAWSWFDLPALTSMTMTVVSILAAPVLPTHPLDDAARIIDKSVKRLLGCCVGGGLAVVLLAWPLDSLPAWLAALFAGVWLSGWLESSPRGIGYVGIQAGMAFVIVLVQGQGPPTSLIPALNRFAGIMLGLVILLGVSFVVRPGEDAGPAPAPAGRA
jgi:uncharacterized membrane protein YccC